VGRILVTRHLTEGGLHPLHAAGHEVVQRHEDVAYTSEELVAAAPEFDAIVCLLTDRIDAQVLQAGAAGRLKVIGNAAVGYDNVDVATAGSLGIVVCNTPGVLDQTTADLAFLLILAATRVAGDAARDLRAGRWEGWGFNDHLGRDVHGQLLGLVGYGHIGREVARRAEGFGMEVLHHTRTNTGFPGHVASLDELLETVDIVSLHVPLTESTRHLIGRREFGLMKTSAVLVNTARGPVVDEEALIEALSTGEIFGAGLDVFDGEPVLNPALFDAPRLVMLPHIGSATTQTRTRMARLAATGVCEVLAGRTPDNAVAP
jgi:glyoxylate reductase